MITNQLTISTRLNVGYKRMAPGNASKNRSNKKPLQKVPLCFNFDKKHQKTMQQSPLQSHGPHRHTFTFWSHLPTARLKHHIQQFGQLRSFQPVAIHNWGRRPGLWPTKEMVSFDPHGFCLAITSFLDVLAIFMHHCHCSAFMWPISKQDRFASSHPLRSWSGAHTWQPGRTIGPNSIVTWSGHS